MYLNHVHVLYNFEDKKVKLNVLLVDSPYFAGEETKTQEGGHDSPSITVGF